MTHRITITYHDCATTYGLSEQDVREFVELGLLEPASTPDALLTEPDHLWRLARLHHELGLDKAGIEVVLLMRHRLLELQQELRLQQARTAQLEHFLRGAAPQHDLD